MSSAESPGLFGREDDLEVIARLVAGARAGEGSVLVVRGEAGIGKSVLLELAQERAEGMRILSARGVEAESELPYATLAQLLGPILNLRGDLPPRQRAALEGALALGTSEGEDRFGVYAAALGLLAEVAEREPLIVLVDDAHWLDTSTAETLRFVARRVASDPIAMVLAARVSEGVSFDAGDLPQQTLDGLDCPAAAALLEARAGVPVAGSVAEELRRATAGNPLALSELAGLLGEAELAGREPLQDPLPVGLNVEALFRAQIAVLSKPARDAAVVAAASTSGGLDEIVAALALLGLDEDELEAVERAGIVVLTRPELRFRHPLMRSTAYHSAPAAERRAAHRALGEVLASHAPGESAWHLAAAALGPDEVLAAKLDAVAQDARLRAAPVAAARAFDEAARLTAPGAVRVQRLLEASRDFHAAGHVERALALLDDAAPAVGDASLRADVAHMRARVQMMDVAPEQTRELLLREADRVEPLDGARAAAMRVDAGFTCLMLGDCRVALELAEQVQPQTESAGGALGLVGSFLMGTALVLAGRRREGFPLLERAVPLIDSPAALTVPFLAGGVGHHMLWAEEHRRGRALLSRLADRARAAGAVTALPYVLACLAEAHFRLGDWALGYAVAAESVALAEEVGQVSERSHSLVRLAAVEAGQGRAQECRDHVEQGQAIAERLGIGSIFVLGGTTLGLLEAGLGRYREAIVELEATGRLAAQQGLREPSVAPWAQELAEANIREGHHEAAETVISELDALARSAESRGALAAVSRCRGLLAADAEFEEHFAAALDRHDEVEAPFERARTELCFGERLRRAGRRVDAREQLRRAMATFGRLGATPWAERAAHELTATGERVRPHSPVTRDRLTAQETQVALTIAAGQTNREAATALFVSPKTIETHLSHIYRKLGVRSRSELTALIVRDGAGT